MWLQSFGEVREMSFYIFAAITALNLVMAIANNILRCFFRGGVAGSSMDFYVSYGCLVLMASILIRGLHNTILSPEYAEGLCQVFPAILTFGLLWLIGGVLLKASAILYVYAKKKDHQAIKYEWMPNLLMLALIIVFAIIVLAWVIGFTPFITHVNGIYHCGGQRTSMFQVVISALHALLLIAALVVGSVAIYRSKGKDTYVESLLLLVTIVTISAVAFVGALIYFTRTVNKASDMYSITAGLMEAGIFVTLLCQLVAKIVLARKERQGDDMDEVYDEVDVDDKGSRRNQYSNGSGDVDGENFDY